MSKRSQNFEGIFLTHSLDCGTASEFEHRCRLLNYLMESPEESLRKVIGLPEEGDAQPIDYIKRFTSFIDEGGAEKWQQLCACSINPSVSAQVSELIALAYHEQFPEDQERASKEMERGVRKIKGEVRKKLKDGATCRYLEYCMRQSNVNHKRLDTFLLKDNGQSFPLKAPDPSPLEQLWTVTAPIRRNRSVLDDDPFRDEIRRGLRGLLSLLMPLSVVGLNDWQFVQLAKATIDGRTPKERTVYGEQDPRIATASYGRSLGVAVFNYSDQSSTGAALATDQSGVLYYFFDPPPEDLDESQLIEEVRQNLYSILNPQTSSDKGLSVSDKLRRREKRYLCLVIRRRLNQQTRQSLLHAFPWLPIIFCAGNDESTQNRELIQMYEEIRAIVAPLPQSHATKNATESTT